MGERSLDVFYVWAQGQANPSWPNALYNLKPQYLCQQVQIQSEDRKRCTSDP